MGLLYLGSTDASKYPNNRKTFLKNYHQDGLMVGKVSFRDDDRTKWRSFRKVAGHDVEKLQQFLKKAGFMTNRMNIGVFDYATQAAVRLFQEYVRTIDEEGDKTMVPDGFVGNGTMAHVNRWISQDRVCSWGPESATTPTKEYTDWFKLLIKAKSHYKANPGPILSYINKMNKTYSTRKIDDWTFDSDEIHLIGIRRNQDKPAHDRKNDDIFILLVNGQVFKFWGSTDPSVRMAGRKDEPFLVEGQQLYRFGWHKVWVEKKIYRAAKPLDANGVLVLRDWNNDNSLTPKDLDITDRNGKPLGIRANNSINIHWSGIGSTNFSAGCQVISGKSYINNKGDGVDCSQFASRSYSELTNSAKKTKGAYNMLADLVVCYSKPGVQSLIYTLGREESLNIDANFGADYARRALSTMTNI
ncbi:peptidoglycan-binding domain-containing protein [Lutibacter citreus]|uniref:peptidoglycan-binding domain-containing protein n=1 Tax=Lutibacter citreus TaxID=2138210 RepID=UPI000DBE444E|nr:peptidoglycan-binding domain-containing protein [Lutibacter citreus]